MVPLLLIQLQQLLPFTVLKPVFTAEPPMIVIALQQLLPFTVLKLDKYTFWQISKHVKLQQLLPFTVLKH